NNDTRNTLFRDLPEDWQSLRLKVAAFAPTASYQSVCLMAYQDDDNYVSLCRDYTGSQQVEWWQETGGNPVVLGSRATSATTDVLLRLDHDLATGTLTASFSLDGSETWLALPGSVVKTLNNPRLGIFVGGNTSTSSFPPVDLQFVAVIGPPPAVEASPASLSFSSLENGADPASQSLSITNTSLGTLSWTASLNQPWLSVSPASGTTPGTITVSVTTSGLAAGTYNGTITVTSPEASNSPLLIPVSLRIISLSDIRVLTVAVLVNAANPAGYNPNPLSPGEFQRYPERYLEHLQVPYEIIDVSTESPPSDLFDRQLIIAGHRGLNLNSTWREAVVDAVNIGVGFINLDWDPQIGSQSHIQMIFGTGGSSVGLPGSTISVPSNVAPGGSTPHYIAGLQKRFLGDPGGAIVYNFHRDENNSIQTVRSTVLTGSGGTVIARLGSDPLILATSFGAGRAVHFGTLEYLKADRFGFLQGVDDLFWRSLVWAARKPFVLRGYPRLWAVQMDDTEPGWAFRVRDMYDPIITGNVGANGIGGPWKVTGYVYTDNLPPESAERASVIADINAGLLQVSPHSFSGVSFGDLYWNGEAERELTDAEWLENLNNVLAWQHGSGGADTIPSFARSMVPHFWDLSDNTGHDLWNSLGFRYVTSIQQPGFHSYYDVTINGGAERPNARPFWLYEKPPKVSRDEDQPFFFADDYMVHSRDGQAAKTFFLFATQVHGLSAPRPDVIWPTSGSSQVSYEWTVAQSLDQFQRHTWRFWSSFAPTQIFTHDSFNYTLSSPTDRRSVIRDLSTWLENLNVRHVFMEDLGDYIYARSKSVLTRATFADGKITYVFTGNAATADGVLVATDTYVFLTDDDGTPVTIPGFTGGNTITLPIPAP
ncbi:MAG TPA: hypothetical protein VNP04_15935, partial [Alphaproteobacteria bacterium]|nr:hypothetical protein [Alphaproteobacteria bacterium]